MAATGNAFRAETASGLGALRARWATDPDCVQRRRRVLIERDRGAVVPLLLLRARDAARPARHFRVERCTV